MDSCVMITNWSIANQSTYVCKKAQRFGFICHHMLVYFRYLEENFSRIALSRHFINLDSTSLLDLVRSPFVQVWKWEKTESPPIQATELEILEATIRWITKEGAEGTLDSFPCYAEFYFEASNQEDRQEIASELMEHIRPDFVLPAFNEVVRYIFLQLQFISETEWSLQKRIFDSPTTEDKDIDCRDWWESWHPLGKAWRATDGHPVVFPLLQGCAITDHWAL